MAHAPSSTFLEVAGFDPRADPRLLDYLRQAVEHDLRAERVPPPSRSGEFRLKYLCLSQAVLTFTDNFVTVRERNHYRLISRIGYPNPVYGRPRSAMHIPRRAVCRGTDLEELGIVLKELDAEERPDITHVRPWPEDLGPHPRRNRPRLATHQVRTRTPTVACAR